MVLQSAVVRIWRIRECYSSCPATTSPWTITSSMLLRNKQWREERKGKQISGVLEWTVRFISAQNRSSDAAECGPLLPCTRTVQNECKLWDMNNDPSWRPHTLRGEHISYLKKGSSWKNVLSSIAITGYSTGRVRGAMKGWKRSVPTLTHAHAWSQQKTSVTEHNKVVIENNTKVGKRDTKVVISWRVNSSHDKSWTDQNNLTWKTNQQGWDICHIHYGHTCVR